MQRGMVFGHVLKVELPDGRVAEYAGHKKEPLYYQYCSGSGFVVSTDEFEWHVWDPVTQRQILSGPLENSDFKVSLDGCWLASSSYQDCGNHCEELVTIYYIGKTVEAGPAGSIYCAYELLNESWFSAEGKHFHTVGEMDQIDRCVDKRYNLLAEGKSASLEFEGLFEATEEQIDKVNQMKLAFISLFPARLDVIFNQLEELYYDCFGLNKKPENYARALKEFQEKLEKHYEGENTGFKELELSVALEIKNQLEREISGEETNLSKKGYQEGLNAVMTFIEGIFQ